jgi:hypothetical protein
MTVEGLLKTGPRFFKPEYRAVESSVAFVLAEPQVNGLCGERMTVSGKDYVRNGSHGLVIDKVAREGKAGRP